MTIEQMDARELSALYLAKGSHKKREAGVCAMEAVAWLAGEKHSDSPACTCVVLAAFVRRLNDALPNSERQRLVGYLPRLIGTVGSRKVQQRRAFLAADFAVREAAVAALRARGRTADADRLAALSPIVDRETAQAARSAADAAAAGRA